MKTSQLPKMSDDVGTNDSDDIIDRATNLEHDTDTASEEAVAIEANRSKSYSYIIIGLLLLAALGLYGPKLLSSATEDDSVAASAGLTYVSDLDFWQRTKREVQITSEIVLDLSGDLNLVPKQIGKWAGQDMPDTNREVEILLEPEQYVRRLYQHEDGKYMWLSLIGGRSSQPFHAPDICYDADGWQYEIGSHPFALSNGSQLFSLWLDAEKIVDADSAPLEHFVSYFYIFPDQDRELSDGIVLFKLTSSRFGTQAENLEVHQDFVSSIFGGM